MEQITLPRVEASATLREALTLMRKAKLGALFVDLHSGPAVIDVDIMLHALRSNANSETKLNLGDLKPRSATLDFLPSIKTVNLSSSSTKRLKEIESQLDEKSAAFGVAKRGAKTVTIATRYETFRNAIAFIPTLWVCNRDADHILRAEDLLPPDSLCPYDGEPSTEIS
ncbi:hypothetical protein ELI00_37035 [Rhizobium ruizarguesonis]|uniref:hypothetical protein n=1 Tax=Rhizobium ruizarguesonis TaxID=2081791 RepID=UPI0010311152|nr:hypothetical protein [Rhizobium ruizarguesonis]TAX63553.1 hypothetical protein ELI00_37035 [Rhizobium ruizarguesonis]